MTDHPIPDDLRKQMYVATGHGADGAPIIPRHHVDAVLAEWANGALIDPWGWRRLDAQEVGGDPTNPAALYVLKERRHG